MHDVVEMKGLSDEAGETAEPVAVAPTPKVLIPKCPHCGADPATLALMFQKFPGGQIGSIIFCSSEPCRKIISAQIIGMERGN
jgi:hypothetical protein